MNKLFFGFLIAYLLPLFAMGQSDQHYSMFMYNKLLYNPAYAGSRDVASVNADYRDQWDGINGAPKTINVTVDAPIGSFMQPFRKVALGISFTNEKLGVENNNDIKAYYAYRIKLKKAVVSFGLSGGVDIYTANYTQLNLYQPNDPNFTADVKNAMLPNFGAGIYVSADNYYYGLSVPNLLQDTYDKKEVKVSSLVARQSRGYYLSAGYVYTVNETIKLEPQFMFRFARDANYRLPYSCDFNLSAIMYDRFMVGVSYRTDKSFEGIIHIQATQKINIGYAYDYLLSGLNGYSGGTHELVIGYDFVKDNPKFLTPRFLKKF
jgi:type IX secretion system PorP/SprF family membrane protein